MYLFIFSHIVFLGRWEYVDFDGADYAFLSSKLSNLIVEVTFYDIGSSPDPADLGLPSASLKSSLYHDNIDVCWTWQGPSLCLRWLCVWTLGWGDVMRPRRRGINVSRRRDVMMP